MSRKLETPERLSKLRHAMERYFVNKFGTTKKRFYMYVDYTKALMDEFKLHMEHVISVDPVGGIYTNFDINHYGYIAIDIDDEDFRPPLFDDLPDEEQKEIVLGIYRAFLLLMYLIYKGTRNPSQLGSWMFEEDGSVHIDAVADLDLEEIVTNGRNTRVFLIKDFKVERLPKHGINIT